MNKIESLMSKCNPSGPDYKKLEDCCQILDNQRKPISSSNRVSGDFPYYGANGVQDFVNNYLFDGKFVLVGEDGSVLTKEGHPVVNWATGKIWVNNHAHILAEKEGVSLRYLFHYLQFINISNLVHGNIPKLTGKDLRNLKIAVPSLEVQCEIVRILDNFAELTAELTAELSLRKSQAKFYTNFCLNIKDAHEVKLGDICEIGTGSSNTSDAVEQGIYPFYVRSQDLLAKNEYEYDETAIITAGDGVGVGKVFHFVQGKYALHQRAYRIKPIKKNVDAKFLYFYIKFYFPSYILRQKFEGSVPSIRRPMLTDFIVFLPELSKQLEIANILQQFEKYNEDINAGLPAEIELRKKQYAFYRDKLLSFNY